MFLRNLVRTSVRSATPLYLAPQCAVVNNQRYYSLKPETVAIVKSTAPVLAEHGYDITKAMYKKMLSENSDVKALFNPSHQVVLKGEEKARQPWSLACTVHAYAAHIDDLGALTEAVERIAQKHVSLYVLPEHYPIVGTNLLWAIKHVLGDAATPAVLEAWGEAYFFLADIFIAREKQLREEKAKEAGGWEGWRSFIVEKKVIESDEICSFYLRPEDGGSLPTYKAGQYTAIRVESTEFTTQRNYTLSIAPDTGIYRITVKREGPLVAGGPPGHISNHLHDNVNEGDKLQLGVPCGDFLLDVNHDKPIVLLSGGVGITPTLSMLEYIINSGVKNNVIVVAASRNPDVEAMHGLLAQYRRKHLNLVIKTIYDEGPDGYPKGPLTDEQLDSVLVSRDCHYYFCGPPGFMKGVHSILKGWEIPQDQVHFEFFGPNEPL